MCVYLLLLLLLLLLISGDFQNILHTVIGNLFAILYMTAYICLIKNIQI